MYLQLIYETYVEQKTWNFKSNLSIIIKKEIDNLPNVPFILAMTFNMTCPINEGHHEAESKLQKLVTWKVRPKDEGVTRI
jgi:hypothetical protein